MPKGSKTSAFDAALQYVKNKLPRMGFFSTLDELIGAAPFEKAPIDQWKAYLKPGRTFEREGVRFPLKQEELDYSGLNELAPRGESYDPPLWTKDLLRKALQKKRPDLRLGIGIGSANPTFLPSSRWPAEYEVRSQRDMPRTTQARYTDYAHGADTVPYEEQWTRSTDFGPPADPKHFGPDVSSHSRMTMQPTQDERLMRLIEEIQSDLHQAAAERWTPGSAAAGRGEATAGQRRGYRTPADEQEMQRLSKNATWDNQTETIQRLNELKAKVADAPFKDPADYGLLELKQQLLNAVNQDADYLGLIRGEDVSRRFSQRASEAEGTSHIYDKVYPSVMRKLANQYGAEVRDVPTTLKDSIDVASPTMRGVDAETTDDFLARIYGHLEDLPPGGTIASSTGSIDSLIDELQASTRMHAYAAKARNRLQHLRQMDSTGTKQFDRAWNELAETLKGMHYVYAEKIRAEKGSQATNKSFPAMVLTPEVRERIKKAGIPIWSLAGLGASTVPALMSEDEQPAFAEGGSVSGIDRLRQLAESVGTSGTVDRRKRLLSGLASQWYGVNPDTGEVEFMGGASLLPKIRSLDEIKDRYRIFNETGEFPDEGRPGIIDEIQAMFLGTDKADRADARLEELKRRIRERMEVGEAHGFQENFDESLGTMLGQIPVPTASGVKTISKPLMQRLRALLTDPAVAKRLAKSTVKQLPEWLTPYVEPSPMAYLTGATVGGGIGAISDALEEHAREERQGESFATKWEENHPDIGLQMAEGGSVTAPLSGLLGMWKSRLAELTPGSLNMSSLSDNADSDNVFRNLQMKAKGGKVSGIRGALLRALSPEDKERIHGLMDLAEEDADDENYLPLVQAVREKTDTGADLHPHEENFLQEWIEYWLDELRKYPEDHPPGEELPWKNLYKQISGRDQTRKSEFLEALVPKLNEIFNGPEEKAEGGKVKTLLELREALMRKINEPQVANDKQVTNVAREKLDQLKAALPNLATPQYTTPESLVDLVKKPIPTVPSIPLQMSRRTALQGLAGMVLPDVPVNPEAFLAKTVAKQLTRGAERPEGYGSEEMMDNLRNLAEFMVDDPENIDWRGLEKELKSYSGSEGALGTFQALKKHFKSIDWDSDDVYDTDGPIERKWEEQLHKLADHYGFTTPTAAGIDEGPLSFEYFIPKDPEAQRAFEERLVKDRENALEDDPFEEENEGALPTLDELRERLSESFTGDPDLPRDVNAFLKGLGPTAAERMARYFLTEGGDPGLEKLMDKHNLQDHILELLEGDYVGYLDEEGNPPSEEELTRLLSHLGESDAE